MSFKCLLIDDNLINRVIMRKTLTRIYPGIIIYEAGNSKQAIEIFNSYNQTLSIIICDGNLKDSNYQGPELADTLLKIQQNRSVYIPIIAWTDDQQLLSNSKPKNSGSFTSRITFESVFKKHNQPFLHIEKPLNVQSLQSTLQNIGVLPEVSLQSGLKFA